MLNVAFNHFQILPEQRWAVSDHYISQLLRFQQSFDFAVLGQILVEKLSSEFFKISDYSEILIEFFKNFDEILVGNFIGKYIRWL